MVGMKRMGSGVMGGMVLLISILFLAGIALTTVCAAEQVDLFLLMDGSGSISPENYTVQLRGYSEAIKEVIPRDGSVLLCVIMFGYPPTNEYFLYYHKLPPQGYIPYARVIVPPTIITNQSVIDSIVETLNNTPQPGDHTPMAEAFILANKTLTEAIQAGIASKDAVHIIDISSDGRPNWVKSGYYEVPPIAVNATFKARDDAVEKGYFDKVNVLGVDIIDEIPRSYPYNRDFLYLLRYPQPGGTETPGFYMEAANWSVFPEKIKEKIQREIPGLTIEKHVDKAECNPGDTLTYSIHYSNTGNMGLTKVVLTDEVPAYTTVVNSSISDGGSFTAGVITWNIGDLGAGVSGTQTFQVRVHSGLVNGTVIRNVATIDSDETNPLSDHAVTVVKVTPTPTPTPTYHLEAYKLVDKKFALPNDTLMYSIRFRNEGLTTLTNVKIKDEIPENTTYIAESMYFNGILQTDAADGDNGTYYPSNNTLVWDIGTMAPGAMREVNFKVRIDPFVREGTVIENTAILWSRETPPINRSTITVIMHPPEVPALMPPGIVMLIGLLMMIGYRSARRRYKR